MHYEKTAKTWQGRALQLTNEAWVIKKYESLGQVRNNKEDLS